MNPYCDFITYVTTKKEDIFCVSSLGEDFERIIAASMADL